MKKAAIKIGLIILTLAFAAGALAQEGGDKEVYKKRTIIDFSDVTIEGELTKPQGSYISIRRGSKFNKLIKIREDFKPEMDMSLDNL